MPTQSFLKVVCALTTAIAAGMFPASRARADEQSSKPDQSPSSQPAPLRRLIWDRVKDANELAQREQVARDELNRATDYAKNHPEDSSAGQRVLAAGGKLERVLRDKAQAILRSGNSIELEKAAYLGVATSAASPVLRKQLKLPEGVGLVVDYVEPNSPAHAGGLRPFDVAVRLNEQILVNPQQLAVLVRTFDAGTQIKLTVIREGKPIKLLIKLVERDVKPLERVLHGMLPPAERPLRAGDEVRVTIYDLEGPGLQTVKQTIVGENGDIRLPLLNRPVRAVGLSEIKMQQAIAEAYRAEGIVEMANVSVEITPHPGESAPQLVRTPQRAIQENDTVMVMLQDVEGPGVATVKQARIGPAGTLSLPRIAKPVEAVGCTPVQLERSVRQLYRDAGMNQARLVELKVTARPRASQKE